MSTIARDLTAAMQAQQAGQFDDSDRLCAAVLEQDPAHLDAWQLLAASKFLRAQHDEALAVIDQALAHHPASFELNVMAGHCQRAAGRLDRAVQHYARAAALKPESAECHVMLGWTLRALDRRPEAMAQYLDALRINPDLVEAHNNLGVLYHDNGELEPAMAEYRAVLLRQPQHLESRRNLAAALRSAGRIGEALVEFEALVRFHPGHPYASLMILHSKRELGDWSDYEAARLRVNEIAAHSTGAFSPFILFIWPVAPDVLLKAARAYAATATPPVLSVPAAPQPRPGKLRVGYFSADFRDHVVATVIPEVLELHDRNAFDVVAYSYGPDDASAQRRRIQAGVTEFTDIRAISDDAAAAKIRADKIDILVDLTGFTGNIRHGIPARRPAPLQINWLGYPGTSGSPAVDYLVADAFTIPAASEKFYSEKIIRLPGSAQPHDRTRAVAASGSRQSYGLPDTAFVFCSFNHVQKLTPDMFGCWMDILRAVPDAVLWLRIDRDEAVANIKAEARKAGIAENRLIFAPRTASLAEHLARYRVADLALDSFPYGAYTTANDALWLGCPLLTMTGETFPSRVAGGILNALGLTDLATASSSAYRDVAVNLATNASAYAALKSKLAAAKTAPHFDTGHFTQLLEAGYRAAWKIRASGGDSRHITLAPDGTTQDA